MFIEEILRLNFGAGVFRIKNEDPRATLVDVIKKEVLVNDKRSPKQLEYILNQLRDSAVQISEATYSLDQRNTDNAWVETSAYSCHDEHGQLDMRNSKSR